jgi:transcriptional repressor NrdR
MKCPFCGNVDTEVVETRVAEEGASLRRRRECAKCKKRFTTYERVNKLPIVVIKRDGRRELYDREKLKASLIKPCEKTTVSLDQLDEILDSIESELRKQESAEVESKLIGDLVASRLKKINKVAYIRFASVFKRFVEVEEFERELKKLL